MRIVVLDGYTLNPGDNPWDALAALGELTVHDRTPALAPAPGSQTDQIVERAKDAEVVLTNKTPLSAETIAKLPNLKFISILATGYNIVDIAAARARGIAVSNVPVYSTDSVAQHVMAMLLTFCHQPTLHSEAVYAGEWQRNPDFCFWKTPLVELAGQTMGIVGFGRIGQRVGALAHALGMNVIAYSRTRQSAPEHLPFEWRELDELFAESDVVSLHCPQTPENTGMVNRELLGRMKRSAILINASRGGLINEKELAEALNADTIAGACLDVVSREPIEADNPLLKAKHCLITPHIAWATLAARRRLMNTTVENVTAYAKGEPMNVVN